jgi:RNA-binding protein FUS
MNSARRSECNKCGTRAPSADSRGGKSGGSYERGEKNGGYSDNKSSKYDTGNGGSGGAYNKTPPVLPPTYSGSSLPPPSYGGDPPAESPVQCDENCGDTCDNSRIYISNLPLDVTIDELKDLFGGIGQVARIKQKRGFKDQWPWNIKLYTDDNGKNKGDGVVVYEDPAAAHSAGSFYNDHDLRGHKIKVAMAAKSAPRPPLVHAQRGGGRGGYGGGGGPDRNFHGGNRSRPY